MHGDIVYIVTGVADWAPEDEREDSCYYAVAAYSSKEEAEKHAELAEVEEDRLWDECLANGTTEAFLDPNRGPEFRNKYDPQGCRYGGPAQYYASDWCPMLSTAADADVQIKAIESYAEEIGLLDGE